jgi:hypothetical protein
VAYEAAADLNAVTVTASAVQVVSLTADTRFPAAPGTTVEWTAVAAGGPTPLEYQFHLYRPSVGWTVGRAYGASPSWHWTPSEADDYAVQVWVREVGSTAAYQAWRGSGTVRVAAGPVETLTLSVNQEFPVAGPVPIVLTAQASGGTAPLEYQVWVLDVTTGVWAVGRAWGPSGRYAWTPAAAAYGQYVVQVWVRSTGAPSYEAWATTGSILLGR